MRFPNREISFKLSQSGPIHRLEKPTTPKQSWPCHQAAGERGALPGRRAQLMQPEHRGISYRRMPALQGQHRQARVWRGKYRACRKPSERAHASSSHCSEEPCHAKPHPLIHREKQGKYLATQLQRKTFLNR